MGEHMHRTYRYRLCPTASQEAMLGQFVGVCRYVYNLAFEQRRDWGRQFKANAGKTISFYSQGLELKHLRSEVDWIGAVPQCIQVQALRDLDNAFQSFFKGKSGFPSPRCKGRNESFRVPGKEFYSPARALPNPRFFQIRLPKVGWCKARLSRRLPDQYKILEATIIRDTTGWHICLSMQLPAAVPGRLPAEIGIDRGVASTLAFSDGSFASQPIEALRALDRRARRHQRQLSRQKRGSNRRSATRRLLAKTKAKIARVRKHWNHEQTTRIARRYGTVVIEALQTNAMTRSAKGSIEAPGVNVRQKAGLNRAILEHGWYQFERLLSYKLEAAGGQLIKVDPAYTSQTCSACGSVSKTHRKSQAVFECSDCGHAAHADTNAALNILRAGEQPASRGAARPSVKREPELVKALVGFYAPAEENALRPTTKEPRDA